MELVAGDPMKIRVIRAAAPPAPDERRCGWFSQPYGLRDAAAWALHNVAGPSRRHGGLTPCVPRDTIANDIRPALTLSMIGDVLPLRGVAYRVSPGVRAFLAGADALIANFEGTIVEGRPPRVFMGQAHAPDVLDLMAGLFPPERTILCSANNHAADYGRDLFDRSRALLEARGFVTIGGADAPAAVIDGTVAVAAGTDWLNRPAPYIQRLDPGPPVPADVAFRVLCPHWGHELEAFPRPAQVRRAHRQLARWDMVVGHHSHCPQPITLERDGRLVAYSLGNFTFGYDLPHHLHGLALKVSLGPRADGTWAVGTVQWRPLAIRFTRRRAIVELA